MPDSFFLLLCLSASVVSIVIAQRAAMYAARNGGQLPGVRGILLVRPHVWLGEVLTAVAGLVFASFFLLITARPFLSALLWGSSYSFIWTMNRVKEKILREPLVLADLRLFPQIFRYPEMYVPFLPAKKIAAGFVAMLLGLTMLWYLEEPLAWARGPSGMFFLFLAVALPTGLLLLLWQGFFPTFSAWLLRRCPVSHRAARDAENNGPVASALLHLVLAGVMKKKSLDFLEDYNVRPAESRWPQCFENMLQEIGATKREELPHVVLLQLESFSDIRDRFSVKLQEKLKDFLPHWESLKREGKVLPTPEDAFGAYTMRTEFSMLTGLQAEVLGPWAFNPYLLAARRPMWSLARFFAAKGYETVCIHPYHKKFFQRNKVMPNLGFQRFLGIEELGHVERFGPYTSDTALGRMVLDMLEQSAKPMFCFVITMEAHGPWPEGRLKNEDMVRILPDDILRAVKRKKGAYLCHLHNMDALIGMMTKNHRWSWAYSDHDTA